MFGVGVGVGAHVQLPPLSLEGDEGAARGRQGPRGGGAGRAAPQPQTEAAGGALLELALVVLVAARRQAAVPVPPKHTPAKQEFF